LSERISPPAYSWIVLHGPFEIKGDEIIFSGYTFAPPPSKADGQDGVAQPQPTSQSEPRGGVARIVSNQRFTDGTISVDIEFGEIDPNTTAEVMVHHDPVVAKV
jgi:hypothetical protein